MPHPDEPLHDGQCLVCLKAVRDGDELCHVREGDRYVTLCCPLCFEAFKADAATFLARQLPSRAS